MRRGDSQRQRCRSQAQGRGCREHRRRPAALGLPGLCAGEMTMDGPQGHELSRSLARGWASSSSSQHAVRQRGAREKEPRSYKTGGDEARQPLQEGGCGCGRKGGIRRKPGTSPRTRAIHYLSTHVHGQTQKKVFFAG